MQKRGDYLRVLRGGKNGDLKPGHEDRGDFRNFRNFKVLTPTEPICTDTSKRCLTVLDGGVHTIKPKYLKIM